MASERGGQGKSRLYLIILTKDHLDCQHATNAHASTNLTEGSYKLRMKVIQPGFNLNWIEFDFTGNSMGTDDNEIDRIRLFPNPVSEILNINTKYQNFKIEIYDMIGKKIFNAENLNSINVRDFDDGIYLLKLSIGNYSHSKLFIKK